jgi:hypothetical protein
MAAVRDATVGLDDLQLSPSDLHVERRVCLYFRVPYMTVWGQSLVVSGDGRALGDWDPLHGAKMSCKHVGEELVWEAHLSVPYTDSFRYRFPPPHALAFLPFSMLSSWRFRLESRG